MHVEALRPRDLSFSTVALLLAVTWTEAPQEEKVRAILEPSLPPPRTAILAWNPQPSTPVG